jgi:TRAP transporter TAXI family solute receptor
MPIAQVEIFSAIFFLCHGVFMLTRMKFKSLILVAIVVSLIAVSPDFAFAQDARQPQQSLITVGECGSLGVTCLAGGTICRLLGKGRNEHNIRCYVEPAGDSAFNVKAVRSGDLNFGVVQSDFQYCAYNGLEQFKDAGPDPDLRVLFTLHSQALTLVARNDADIDTFDDLPGKRLYIYDPSNRNLWELLMKQYGWTPETFKLAVDLEPAEMARALCADKIDAFIYLIGNPAYSITEASTTCDSHVVPVTGPKVEAFINKHPYYPIAVIPGENGSSWAPPKLLKSLS